MKSNKSLKVTGIIGFSSDSTGLTKVSIAEVPTIYPHKVSSYESKRANDFELYDFRMVNL